MAEKFKTGSHVWKNQDESKKKGVKNRITNVMSGPLGVNVTDFVVVVAGGAYGWEPLIWLQDVKKEVLSQQ